jgi:hypothetical protein
MQMSTDTNPIETFIDVLAERIAAKITARDVPTIPRYATAKANPIGSERAFLDAGRRGAFPTFKLGRQVAARWEDVERYVESRQRPTRVPDGMPAPDDDRALLAKAGVRLGPPAKPARREPTARSGRPMRGSASTIVDAGATHHAQQSTAPTIERAIEDRARRG